MKCAHLLQRYFQRCHSLPLCSLCDAASLLHINKLGDLSGGGDPLKERLTLLCGVCDVSGDQTQLAYLSRKCNNSGAAQSTNRGPDAS